MPKIYSEEDKQRLKVTLLRLGRAQLAHEGYKNTIISQIAEQVGISKSLFYKLFPGKEQFVLQALEEQQSALFERLMQACAVPDQTPAQQIRLFLLDCVRSAGEELVVLTPTEQLFILEHLGAQVSEQFQIGRLGFYQRLLDQIGSKVAHCKAQVFGNLFELLLFTQKRACEAMPFLFESGMEQTTEMLIDATVAYLFET